MTIPVRQKKLGQLIKNTKVSDKRWAKKHWASISQCYSKAPYFSKYKDVFEHLYLTMDHEYLSEVNHTFIQVINEILGIKTKIRWSGEFDLVDGQTERLFSILNQCKATEYLSGPAAKEYFDSDQALKENITVTWMEYGGYQEYPQLNPPFEHGVTILDLLFSAGPDARHFMKSF